MPYGFYVSAEGAHVQSTRLEVITNNLANVDTVGFKRDLAVFQARYAEAIQQGEEEPGTGGIDDQGGGVMLLETKTDFSPGPLKRTGIDTDMAIRGAGFFQVRKGDETFLTRAGNFLMTDEGKLITPQGYEVLDESEQAVYINNQRPWRMTDKGEIEQAGANYRLAIVRPTSLDELEKAGENLFRPNGQTEPVPAGQRSVANKYLEMSGANPTAEMLQLIEASRLLEANARMMQAQDNMLSGLVNRVLR